MITKFKLFESKNSVFENMLDKIAIYLEYMLPIDIKDGFVDCTWENYITLGYVKFEFEFINNQNLDDEIFIEKMDKFLNDYDTNYDNRYRNGKNGHFHEVYVIKLKLDKIEALYKDAEIYYQSSKYNL